MQERDKKNQINEAHLEELKLNIRKLRSSSLRAPLSEQEVVDGLAPEMGRLFEEGEDPLGDERSKKVADSMEEWLRDMLR